MLASCLCALTVHEARAYSAETTEWLAGQVLAALPRTTQAVTRPLEVQLAFENLRVLDDQDPEAAEMRRRCAWDGSGTNHAVARPQGGAITMFLSAQQSLAHSWSLADRAASAAALAQLAQSAADLADPFMVAAPDAGEPDGARAWFSDAVTPSELASIEGLAGSWSADAVVALAVTTATTRAAVLAAVEAGDEAAVAALRAECLGAALALTKSAARAALVQAAHSDDARLRLEPSPLRGPATLRLALGVAAEARLELFDVSGRRVRRRELGFVPAGEQLHALPASWFAGLPAGVYLARVCAANSHAEVRVTLLGE